MAIHHGMRMMKIFNAVINRHYHHAVRFRMMDAPGDQLNETGSFPDELPSSNRAVLPMRPRSNGKTGSLLKSWCISRGASTVSPWQQSLTWRLSAMLGRGCGMTSLASSDVVMILASAHIQMPWVSMDKLRSDPTMVCTYGAYLLPQLPSTLWHNLRQKKTGSGHIYASRVYAGYASHSERFWYLVSLIFDLKWKLAHWLLLPREASHQVRFPAPL